MSHVHLLHACAHGGPKTALAIVYQGPSIRFCFFRAGLELSRPQLAGYQVLRDQPVSASPVLRLQVYTATLGFLAEPSPHVGLIIHFNICEVLSGRVSFLVYLTRREYRKMPLSSSTYILSPHLPFPL